MRRSTPCSNVGRGRSTNRVGDKRNMRTGKGLGQLAIFVGVLTILGPEVMSATAVEAMNRNCGSEKQGMSFEEQAARESINQTLADFVSAWNEGDAERAAQVYTDPHVDVNATPQVEARALTVTKFNDFFSIYKSRISVSSDEIQVFGDRAVQRGEFRLEVSDPETGDVAVDVRRYVEVLQRGPDCVWHVNWGIDGPANAPVDIVKE